MTAKIKKAGKNKGHHHPYKPRGVSQKAFKKVYWPYIPVILVIGLLLALSSSAGALSGIIHNPRGRVLAYATGMSTSGLLSDTNAARSQNGKSSLKLNSKLNAAAKAKASDMAKRNYWSHNTPEGNPPWIFVSAQNYSYQKLGENLAAGFTDEQSTINGWMASPPHRENLLDSAFSEVGFGFANNSDYTSAGGGPMTIVVAFYGKPQVLSASTGTAAGSTSQTPSQPKVSAAAKPATQTPTAAKRAKADPAKKETKKTTPPATTETPLPAAGQLAHESSGAQLALASLPLAQFGTSLAIIGMFAAIGLWLSRHALAVRRVVVHGEALAIRHPLMDIGFLMIAALSFLLSRTAGLIQ